MLLAGIFSASAANWDGGTGPWSTTDGRWDGGQVWSQGGAAIFGSPAGTVTLGESITAASLTFNTTGYVVNGDVPNTFTLNAPVINVANGATATVNTIITGAAGLTIGNTTNFGGTLLLGNVSTYTGTTTITRGTVKLGIANALPTGTTISSSTNGTTLDLNGFDQSVVSISGANQSTITNTSATTATLTISGTANNAWNASSQVITGNLNVTKSGTGLWSPAVDHTFTGVLTLSGGQNIITRNGNLGAIGQASLLLNGTARLTLNGQNAWGFGTVFDRAITISGTGVTIDVSNVKYNTLSGPISGTGSLRYSVGTEGALILAGDNSGFSGAIVNERPDAQIVAASNNAFGASTSISTTSTGTIGFMRSLVDGDITAGSAAQTITLGGTVPGSGLGSIHNFTGDNTYLGNIVANTGSTSPTYGAETGTSLLIKGVVSGGRVFSKTNGGTIALSGANTFTGATTINNGTLRLDFSQSGAPSDNIINNTANTSALIMNGGTLDIKGKGTASSQRFANSTFNTGASTISTQNSANGVTLTLGGFTRNTGSTIDFVLPASGTIETSSGGSNNILTSSAGVAYATVGGTDWAAKAANGTTIVSLATLASGGPGYTPTTATTLAGNANISPGVDTTVGTTANTSLRFGVSESRTVTLTGDLTTGGILVSSTVGGFVSTITGGNLRSPTAASAQDLVIIQNNTANVLSIGSSIVNNANGTNLVKAGAGTLDLTGANSYAGVTNVTGGTLKLSNAAALPGGIGATGGTSNLLLRGGVIGLNTTSGDPTGDFVRGLGTGATQVQFTGSGGFAAYGSNRTVNLGGLATPSTVTWGSGSFVPLGFSLILGAPDANAMVELKNNIILAAGASPVQREIYVYDGLSNSDIDAKISGVISTQAGIIKNGAGTLELSATNTYRGATTVNEGTLRVTGTNSGVSSTTQVAYFVNNGARLQIAQSGIASHPFTVSAGTAEFDNSTVNGNVSYTAQGLTLGGGIAGSTATVSTGTGTMTLSDNVVYNGSFHNDAGATISGNLSLGAATRTFTVNNSTAAANDLTISAPISQTAAAGVTKAGNGTLNLAGASTYTGATTVSAGTLLVSGSIAGAVTVQSGATLGGTGMIGGTVTVNSGATLAAGSSPGTLEVGNTLALGAGATFKLELGGATPGDGAGFYDQVNMTNAGGSVSLDNAAAITLSLQGGYIPQAGDVFFVLNRADGGAFSTSFAGAAEGATIDFGGGVTGQITYKANWNFGAGTGFLTGGNDVALYNLSVVPEPGAFSSLLLGLGSLVGLQRFRRRRS